LRAGSLQELWYESRLGRREGRKKVGRSMCTCTILHGLALGDYIWQSQHCHVEEENELWNSSLLYRSRSFCIYQNPKTLPDSKLRTPIPCMLHSHPHPYNITQHHNPSIYLSIPSHCVLPVDIKYRICVRSSTPLFLLNSSLANPNISSLVLGSEIRLQPRTMVRHSERARLRWRK